MRNKTGTIKILLFLLLVMLQAKFAFAEARTKEELEYFLDSIGTFLINVIGPGVLVIGVAIAGISMALGNEDGMKRGAFAAVGGALIMLARAVLDLMKNLTGF